MQLVRRKSRGRAAGPERGAPGAGAPPPRTRQPSHRHRVARTSRPWPASAKASCVAKVLLPTPPLPDSTSNTCFTLLRRAEMAARSGSGPAAAAVAQAAWLGQPSQAASRPALSLPVPGQSVEGS